MKKRIWLGIATLTFVAGWGLGRHGGAGSGDKGPAAAGPGGRHAAMSPAEDRQNRELLARQTAEKFHARPAEEVADVFTALDPAMRGPALETWITSLGPGSMPAEDQQKLQSLLDTWAKMDFEGARRWADGLKSRSLRQLALVGLAGAIAGDDPEKAFECLISNGPFSRGIEDFRVQKLMKNLADQAIAAGGDALISLWQRLPEGTEDLNYRSFLNLGSGKDVDFRGAMDAYIDLRDSSTNWPLMPSRLMSNWAAQDPQAATDYLAEKITSQDASSSLAELRNAIAAKEGKAAAQQWTLDFFNSIPPEQLADAIRNGGYDSVPGRLLSQLPPDISPTDRDRLAIVAFQNAVDKQTPLRDEDLRQLPAAERLNVLNELRGVTDPDSVLEQAQKAGASEAGLADLKERITRPQKSSP